jgi:hypothetical protein
MKKYLFTLAIVSMVFTAQSQSWLLEGNSGTNTKIHFIGTKDDRSLFFKINNTFSGLLDSTLGQTFFGYRAGNGMANGRSNVAIGYKSLSANSTGYVITSVGAEALLANTTGHENVATGYSALYYNTTGSQNTATGNITLFANINGNANSAHGFGALSQSTGSGNTANGYEALYQNYTGSYNVADGYLSNAFNKGGSFNTSVGSNSLLQNYGAYYNTCVGYNAGRLNLMGWNNTLLGANADVNANDRYNCIAIGQGVTCTANSQARIGNSATTSIGGYASWTNISDGRYKKDIQQNVKGLEFIMKLQPVTYHLDISGLSKKLGEGLSKEKDKYMDKAIKEKEKILFSGFVAQDVEKAAKETGYDFSGVDKPGDENDLYGLRYAEFVVPLVKAVQEQQAIIKKLQVQVEAGEAEIPMQIGKQQQMIQKQEEIIGELIKQNTSLQKRMEELEKRQGVLSTVPEGLAVWPNPSNNNLFIHIDASQQSTAFIKITDSKGALVKQEQVNITTGSNQFTIDMKGLAKGIYYVSAEWNKGQIKKSAQVVKL